MSKKSFVFRDGEVVPKQEARARPTGPQIISDIADYLSPLGNGPITSRSKRREDLKRGNCREVDPGEFNPTITNPRFARKYGLPLTSEGRDQ